MIIPRGANLVGLCILLFAMYIRSFDLYGAVCLLLCFFVAFW